MKNIAGYLFDRDDNRLLTYRKSWRSYAIGFVIAAAAFLAVLLFSWIWLRGSHTFYVGGGRYSRGTPIAPANQTWGQFAQSTVCPSLFLVPVLFLAVGYIIGGSDEQRNPFVFDRQRDRVFYGPKELCKLSAIVAIRLVQTPRSGTGIFARLKGPPWSIELGCFRRFGAAQRFAEEISKFLNLGLYDDPIIPRQKRGRGFDVKMPSRAFLLIFGLPWTVLVCLLLGFFCHDAFNQWRAMSFASTNGVVDTCNQIRVPGHRGYSYRMKIAYHYNVDHRQYQCDRVQFLTMSSYEGWQLDMLRRFPAGTHPTVFYNPSNPAEAALVRGIQGDDLFAGLFLMPFTVIMLAIWFAIVASFRKSDGLGLRNSHEETTTPIRQSPWYAVGAAAAGLGFSAFASILIVGLLTGGHPSLAVAALAWGVTLTIGAVAGVAKFASLRSGL